MKIIRTTTSAIKDFIKLNHYSGKVATAQFAFCAVSDMGDIEGAITYGPPASPFVAISIRGDANIPVYELNRLAIASNDKNAASKIIGRTLKLLPKDALIVSYADTKYSHVGYVYQATNFHYSGTTKARTDIYSESGHARHHCGDTSRRQPRSAKHRYWIGTSRKAELYSLWDSLPYPKGETKRHISPLIKHAPGCIVGKVIGGNK